MSQRIPATFIQDIVARTDIVTVIASRIELKKRGGTHMACCPFHHEKTPSFTVSAAKQFYYCFGCGAHGDVIHFLTNYDHLSFLEVVTDLAAQLGMEISKEWDQSSSAENKVLYDVMYHAQTNYEQALKQSTVAIEYLKNRGLTGKIAKQFGIGFAPDAWDFLVKALPDHRALLTAGLVIEKTAGRYYDRFRNRVLFPIRDVRGRTIGFGGRTMTDEIPKYLNSPETPIFHKNQTLYGLYEACRANRVLKRALVVEGYLDVISLAQHGIAYGVATLGTALNVKHIQLLLRYTNDIVFCFDGDAAGQKAAWKALTISLPLLRDGLNFRFLFLTDKEDPDSLVQKIGQTAFETLVDHAISLSRVFFDELSSQHDIREMAGQAAFAKDAKALIETMPEGIYKNLMLDELAKKLSLRRDKLEDKKQILQDGSRNKQIPKRREGLNPAVMAIQLLLQAPMLSQLSFVSYEAMDTPEKQLLVYLVGQYKSNPSLSMTECFASMANDRERALLASIATLPLHVPENGREAEFLGAMSRLREQEQASRLSFLMAQKKTASLTEDEMQEMKQLLFRKHSVSDH